MSIIRTLYLIFPALLTLVSLVLTILVFLDQLSRSSSVLNSLYFLKIDTGAFSVLQQAGIDVADWYSIGLWNYCTGNTGSSTPTFCSPAKAFFYFDPVSVWSLERVPVESLAPAQWTSGINTYKAVSKWLFIAYLIAIILVALTTLMGAFTFCLSRGSSCFTTFLASLAATFSIAASATATALFLTIKGLLHEKLHTYGVTSALGSKLFTYTWLAAAFALVASIAWLFSCCCGADHKDSHRKPRRAPTFGQNNYARVPEPVDANGPRREAGYYGSSFNMEVPKGTSYEPYRHERV